MRTPSALLIVSALVTATQAAPYSGLFPHLARDDSSPATLPQDDLDPKKREADVAARNEGFVYGPSLIGEAAFFPNGTLGNARTKADMDLWQVDREDIDARIEKDVAAIQQALLSNGGLKSMDDYANVLYQDQWKNANPHGTTPGIMSNYTQDLLFSMERLSENPYPLRMVQPDEDLPFELDDFITFRLAGVSIEELKEGSNLFYVDHSYQEGYDKTTLEPKRYGAACSAYFFTHPETNDFLPLAIKTNTGSDLTYSPLDSENDWLLAKLMFNVNDMFDSQMRHLVISHDVSEAVHQAALHTLSDNHPIMVILERLMLQGYSSRIVGEELCFNPGGHWDQLMYVSNVGCREYVTETWPTSGKYQAGYLHADLKARGLLNDQNETPFKSFPFFQDADRIHQGFQSFFESVIESYYPTDDDLTKDYEIQNWFVEATENAKVHDFPPASEDQPVDKATLADVLTHFGFIVSVVHHSLNGGWPVGSKATLPFHLPALYAPVPDAKGVTDLMPFLPPPTNAVHYIGFIASFNRPFYEESGRNLESAFADSSMKRLNEASNQAATDFFNTMQTLSDEIRSREFGSDGLSLGMPFVYQTLDPGYIPFFCAV